MNDSYDDRGLTGRAWLKPLVALWFGGLAAAGMFFMPPDVHASIARALGLAGLHPMFAAPVAQAGVLVLCGAAFLLGALLGLLIAWRIARAARPRSFAPGFEIHDDAEWADETAEAEAFEEPRRRRVFSAREDIGEEGISISAPTVEDDYEAEYSLEDIPQVTPEEDFDAVYAEMDEDYVASENEPEEAILIEEPGIDEPVGDEAVRGSYPGVEDAEFEDVEDREPQAHFEPQHEPEPDPETGESEEAEEAADFPQEPADAGIALGDMSLEDLVGRLEGALEQHRKIVSRSEEAAMQPPPQPVPLMREPAAPAPTAPTPAAPADEPAHDELPEASDDDPVIAFLRREASRRMPQAPAETQEEDEAGETAPGPQTEAQAALRHALDRLGQVNRRD